MSRLDLVVGPNGAGKTTFARRVLLPTLPASAFVNADEIALERWPDAPMAHAYDASEIAERTRTLLIELGEPFIAETVFSHPSKIDLIRRAQEAGYHVALHVLLVPEELSVERVRYRVAAGGHDVPVEKIRGRFARLWSIVVQGIELADTADVWDNAAYDGPKMAAQFSDGVLAGNPHWPPWTPQDLSRRWPG